MFICLLYVVCNCMYVRIGLYIYKSLTHSRLTTYIHKQTHIHTHKQTHIHTHKHTHTHTQTDTYTHTQTPKFAIMHTNAHTLTQIQQICIHVHTNKHTHTHTHTHAATVYLKIQIFNCHLQYVFRIVLPFSFYCVLRNDLFSKFLCIREICKKMFE